MSSPIALLLLKVSVLLGAALLAARLMTRSTAGRRHSLWSAAFLAAVSLPALGLLLPAIEIAMPAVPVEVISPAILPAAEVRIPDRVSGVAMPPAALSTSSDVRATPAFHLPSLSDAMLVVWLLGFCGACGGLLISLARVARLSRRGRPVANLEWHIAAASIAARLGVKRPIRLIASESVTTPMAAGITSPTVFVPADATSWSPERRDVVLAHEIAHIASRDPLRHLVGRTALAFYWFHPFAWLAARDATSACEQACDEAVLSLGVLPSTYAQVLLDFAAGTPAPALALPIVRRGLLETRLMAILEHSPRRVGSGRMIVPAALGTALTLCVAAIQPATGTSRAESFAPPPTATPVPSTATVPPSTAATSPAPAPRLALEAVECGRGGWNGGSSGTTTNSRNGVIDRTVQQTYSDLRVCASAERMEKGEARPSEWIGRAEHVVLQTEERSGDLRRMEIARGVTTYSVNGRPASMDGAAQEWRGALVGLLDAIWEANQLQGRVNSLHGEINSIQGERNSMQGELNSLQGEVNSMQGEINSLRGEENSLRGEINSINGQVNSLQGQINSERGSISSLQAARYDRPGDRDAIDGRIRSHEEAIRRIEDEVTRYGADQRIRAVERRIANLDTDRKVASVQRRIQDFDLEGKTAEVQRRLARLDVEGQVGSIEREIQDLHPGDRELELQQRADAALQNLRARLRR